MIVWKYLKYKTSIFAFCLLAFSCNQSDYTKLVKAELSKGIREDSILFGIKFGDTRNEFFGTCFDLNKQRLVTHGPTNSSVQYVFYDSSVHSKATQMRLLFYPSFDAEEKINNMNMELTYTGWAPWNRHLQSDSLMKKTQELLLDWYGGNEFIIANVNATEVPVKLDGNRRVLLYVKDAQSVMIQVQDILHPTYRHSIHSDNIQDDKKE